MIEPDSTTVTAFNATIKGAVYLVEMDFKSTTIRFNSSAEDLTVDGNLYIGRGQLVDFPSITETEATGGSKVTFGISLVNEAMKAANINTKTGVIVVALEELIRKSKISELKSFKGKVDLDIDLDVIRGR